MRAVLVTVGKDLTLAGVLSTVGVGNAASFTLTAVGGTAPYTITVASEDLPAEWTITPNTDGTVDIETTEAEEAGEFSITFRLKDAERDVRLITRTLRVVALPLEISGPLDNMTVGDDYAGLLAVSGGIPPYSIVSSTVPAGINVIELVNLVSVAGNPTGAGLGPGTSFPFTVSTTVEDSVGTQAVFMQGITITVAPLTLTGTLPVATETVAYSESLTRAGGSGNITITSQTGFPSALSAAADNVNSEVDVTGTPAAGTAVSSPYAVSIGIQDAEGNTASWNDSLAVQVVPLTYSAWNPSDKSSVLTLSDSNRRSTRDNTGDASAMVRAVTGKTVGPGGGVRKIEFHLHVSPNFDIIGAARSTTALGPASGPGVDAASWGFYSDTGQTYHNNTLSTYGLPFKTGTGGENARRAVLVIDLENGRMKLGVEDTPGGTVGWGDGSGGTTSSYASAPWGHTGITGTIYPAISQYRGQPLASSLSIFTNPADFTTAPISGVTDGWPD